MWLGLPAIPRLCNCVRSVYISLVFPPRRPMGADCCDHRHLPDPHRGNPTYRRVLWAVLAINAVMFTVEIGAGLAAGSAALQAAALDVLGAAGNYGLSPFVVGVALRRRA